MPQDQVLATPTEIQLSAKAPGKAMEDGTSAQAPTTHIGGQNAVPAGWPVPVFGS